MFPFDVSLFEIHAGLSWVPRDNGPSILKTISIYSDGAVFFYRLVYLSILSATTVYMKHLLYTDIFTCVSLEVHLIVCECSLDDNNCDAINCSCRFHLSWLQQLA